MSNVLDYTMFKRVNGEIVLDRDGKYTSDEKVFVKPDTRKVWTKKERRVLYNIVVNSNNTTYKEVDKKFSSAGYKDLRPVHVVLVKRAISTNSKHRYINNLPLFGK
jgi:hypothetical protein